MSRLNVPLERPPVLTHEGGPAYPHLDAEQQLRRSVLSCLLWEGTFYEDGQKIAERIGHYAAQVPTSALAALAIEARSKFHLRHVPLLLLTLLARKGRGSSIVSETIAATIQRADELTEFLAVYADGNGVAPNKLKSKLSAQVKLGLAAAFHNFDEYALSKYNRDGAIKLRDVLFLAHPRPKSPEQEAMWKRLASKELQTPDTWEVALAGGADKKATFERLIREGQLGYFALLRNLRGMQQAGCDEKLVLDAVRARGHGAHRVLPFRYIAAARAVPAWEGAIDEALCASIEESPVLPGTTVVLVDISGSMDSTLSAKSDLKRCDAAAALASVIRCERLRVFSFTSEICEVPPRRGLAGVDAVLKSQPHGSTRLGHAIEHVNAKVPHDRLIVISDEQTEDRVPTPVAPKAYMLNVASNQNGVGYGKGWTAHFTGFSEGIICYIAETEALPSNG
jgi:60 kDa SS-A/Ro ribonucleoprotein